MDLADQRALRQWFIRLADGDRSALAPALTLLRPFLVRFCSRMLSNATDAEDAVQVTLLKVFARAADFDSSHDALTWVLRIAKYECLTIKKLRQRRREEGPPPETVPEMRASAEARLADIQLVSALRAVLESLSPADIATITAAIGETERPKVKKATFRKRAQRAWGRLRDAWRTRHGI